MINSVLLGLEIVIVIFGAYKVFRFIKAYKEFNPDFPVEDRIEAMVTSQVKNRILTTFLTRDLLIIFYIFSKSKINQLENERTYTVHKKVCYGGLVFGIIFALVLEGVGITFLLHSWSLIAAWVHIVLSAYMIVFFIADYRGLKRGPIILTHDKLRIRMGLRIKTDISLTNIESIQNGKLHYEEDKKKKDTRDLNLIGFEIPDFEILLKDPMYIRDGFGRNLLTKKIYLSIDEKETFLDQFNRLNT
jgi:hypothetical protein